MSTRCAWAPHHTFIEEPLQCFVALGSAGALARATGSGQNAGYECGIGPKRVAAAEKQEELALRTWLAAHVAAPFELEPLRVEASHRRFYRLRAEHPLLAAANRPRTLVVMSSPPALEDNEGFVRLAGALHGGGIRVPQIQASDLTLGYVLMSDLGERHLIDAYGTPEEESALDAALATLIDWQSLTLSLPPYTEARLRDELSLFTTWFVGTHLAEGAPSGWQSLCDDLIGAAIAQPTCPIHRDFHSKNLLVGGAQTNPGSRLGVVDFQDALEGPAFYDLASLLRDCYHRFDEATISRCLAHYLAASPLAAAETVTPGAAKRWLDLIALQRQLKAAGIFARLCHRDGKTSHLRYLPAVLTHAADVARSYPETASAEPTLRRYAGKLRADGTPA